MTGYKTHPDADLLRARIDQEQVLAIYNLTWIDNLPSIFRLGGLQSKDFLVKNGVRNIKTSGSLQSLLTDQAAGNWDKVRLTWCWPHPMFFGMENKHLLCLIEIDPEVALLETAIFTDSNSHDYVHARKAGFEGLQRVDFNAVRRSFPNAKETKRRKQAEILVPHVPLDFFQRIIFGSEASRRMALAVTRDWFARRGQCECRTRPTAGRTKGSESVDSRRFGGFRLEVHHLVKT
jgi:hypothetical protein